MHPTFHAGTLPIWRDVPVLRRSLTNVDELRGDYKCALTTTLVPGDAVPGFPGMIIMDATERNSGISHEYSITAEGSLDNSQIHKIIARGRRRTTEAGWDERTVRYLSNRAAWRSCTAEAATDVITTSAAHGFTTGQRCVFARLTGGSGLTAQSSSSLGTVYFVHVLSSTTFKACTTYAAALAGSSFVNISTDMTAGEYIAAEFALGAPHPDHSTLFLCELQADDDATDWETVQAVYRGLERDKPFHRLISVNSQQFSSSSPITNGGAGGWSDARYTNFHLPEVVVTDTYLAGSGTLPTNSIPDFDTPPNAPSIKTITLTDDTDDLTWNYPYGWTRLATPHVATLNSQISAMVYSISYRYIWPVMFR